MFVFKILIDIDNYWAKYLNNRILNNKLIEIIEFWNLLLLCLWIVFFRGDTTLILGTCAGILTGGWLLVKFNYQDDIRVINPLNNPIIWPSLVDIGKYIEVRKLLKHIITLNTIIYVWMLL